jgi:hypothetical protein
MFGMSSTEREWPEVVGYQHEVLHTGVLRHLLEGEMGTQVAARLLDAGEVSRVGEVRLEQRLAGFRGKPDLIAQLVVDGQEVGLAVETKVDSDVRPGQLLKEAEAPARGVLLSVGVTALKLTNADLEETGATNWRVVGPADWVNVLAEVAAEDDAVFAPYLRACRREAEDHRRACELVLGPALPAAGGKLRHPRNAQLQHFAWLEAVRRLSARSGWRAEALLSGAGMLFWSSQLGAWREAWGRDLFMQFDRNDQRCVLRLKVGGPKGQADIQAAVEAARELALRADPGWKINSRQPHAQTDTHSAAHFDFSDRDASDAADLTDHLIAQIEAGISRVA